MDERVMSFSWANSPSMDMPFSEKAQGLRASPNGYPAVIFINSSGGGIATTLDSHYYKGQGEREGTEREFVLVLNDQGGCVMDVADKAATLRAQEHGHQPIICFEPGIAKREGGGQTDS